MVMVNAKRMVLATALMGSSEIFVRVYLYHLGFQFLEIKTLCRPNDLPRRKMDWIFTKPHVVKNKFPVSHEWEILPIPFSSW